MPGLDPDATLLPKERMKETLQFLGGGEGGGEGVVPGSGILAFWHHSHPQ